MSVNFNAQSTIKYDTSQGALSSNSSGSSSAGTIFPTSAGYNNVKTSSDATIFPASSAASGSSSDVTMAAVQNYDPEADKSEKAAQEIAAKKKEKAKIEKQIKKIEGQIKKEDNESKVSDLKIKLYPLKTKLTSLNNQIAAATSKATSEEYDPSSDVGSTIFDGIKAVGGAIVDGVKEVGGAIVEGVKAVGGAIANSLASAAEKVGLTRNTTGLCYGGVKESLVKAGLFNNKGEISGVTGGMSAYEAADVLAKNNKFAEVSSQYAKAEDLRNLPQGAVVVWNKGVGNLSKEHGHISIALGDGRESSDHVQKQIVVNGATAGNSYRVFLPT